MNARKLAIGAFSACLGVLLLTPINGCATSGVLDPLAPPTSPAKPSDPAPSATPKSIVHRDISYTSPGSTRNQLDVHLPLEKRRATETILYIHGGGWYYGDKNHSAALLELLTDAGFPVVTCNYTLSTVESPGYPQAVYDVKAVVRWIRTEGAAEYGLPSKIVVVGESAGGYLALMLGTTDGIERFEPQGPFPGSYRVDAVISFFGPGDLVYHALFGFDLFSTAWFLGGVLSEQTMPLYIEASPITYVSEANPPMALLHGHSDLTVPFGVALLWQQALANVCRHCRLIDVPEAGHGFEGFGGDQGAADSIIELIPELMAEQREPDLNGDGVLDLIDVKLFTEMLIDPGAYFAIHAGCNSLQADQNGDGMVDGRDIANVAQLLMAP